MKRKILLTAALSACMMLWTGINASADVIDIPPMEFELEIFPGEEFYLQHYDELVFLQEQEYIVTNSCKVYSRPDGEVASIASQDDIMFISAVYTSESGEKWGYTQFSQWISMDNIEVHNDQTDGSSQEASFVDPDTVTEIDTSDLSDTTVSTEETTETSLAAATSKSDVATETTTVSVVSSDTESTSDTTYTSAVTTEEQTSEEAALEETSDGSVTNVTVQPERTETKPSFVLPAVLAAGISIVSAVLIILMKKKK